MTNTCLCFRNIICWWKNEDEVKKHPEEKHPITEILDRHSTPADTVMLWDRSTELLTGKSLHTTAPEVASQFTASHLHKAQCNCRNATLNINCDNVFLKVNRKKMKWYCHFTSAGFFFVSQQLPGSFVANSQCWLQLLHPVQTQKIELWKMARGRKGK